MRRPLHFRDFRLLFTGETVSVVGDYFHFVALMAYRFLLYHQYVVV
jgi:hypothetical protein